MAIVEILLLSFVGELLLNLLSTSNGLTQGYGAIRLVDGKGSDQFCVRAESVDLCYKAFMIFLPVKKECWWLQRHLPSVVVTRISYTPVPTIIVMFLFLEEQELEIYTRGMRARYATRHGQRIRILWPWMRDE